MIAKFEAIKSTQPKAFPGGLMDQVLGILDSKIQYQEFKINQAVKSYVDIPQLHTTPDQSRYQPIMDNNLRVLELIDSSNHIISLIFIIRKRVTHSNAKVVLNLISEKRFENFTAKGLTEFFDKPWNQKKIP